MIKNPEALSLFRMYDAANRDVGRLSPKGYTMKIAVKTH